MTKVDKGVRVILGKEDVMKKVGIKQAVEIGASFENMNMTEVARASGREQSTLSNLLKRGKPSMRTVEEILSSVNAKLIVQYSNGMNVELVID